MKVFKPKWWNLVATITFHNNLRGVIWRSGDRKVRRAHLFKRCVRSSCRQKFTDHNPESGGGMCRSCWSEFG